MKAKTSFGFRQSFSVKAPSKQRERRNLVRLFYGAMALMITFSCLSKHGSHSGWVYAVLLLCSICSVRASDRKPGMYVYVSSLEDRAHFQYGRGFDDLGEAEQKDILSKYQVGTYLMRREPWPPEASLQQEEWHKTWWRLRLISVALAALYMAALLWCESHPGSESLEKVLDPPLWIVWPVTFALTLPVAIQFWRRQDHL